MPTRAAPAMRPARRWARGYRRRLLHEAAAFKGGGVGVAVGLFAEELAAGPEDGSMNIQSVESGGRTMPRPKATGAKGDLPLLKADELEDDADDGGDGHDVQRGGMNDRGEAALACEPLDELADALPLGAAVKVNFSVTSVDWMSAPGL